MEELKQPLSNLQLELLKLYGQGVSETDLVAIKKMIAQYFAQQAEAEFDALATQNAWTSETMEAWAKEHHRAAKV
jgi:hypothetical protein